ncbi:MAG: glucose-1-phosphate thymidylyltransferase, partial [Halieaceae bacterium]|nr:glucose-1-phosphate thymidylyltransferase [Halieaceae bacterium]
VACLEEIAYRMGYIRADQGLVLATSLLKSGYGAYLENMISNDGPFFDGD